MPWYFPVRGIHTGSRIDDMPTLSDTHQFGYTWNRQIEPLSSRVRKNATDHQRMNEETWQLVDTGCELWLKRTKNSTHLNVSCFDPILSHGKASATGQMRGEKEPQSKLEGTYQKMAHPACRQAHTTYANKHTMDRSSSKQGRLSSSVIRCWKNKWKIKILWEREWQINERQWWQEAPPPSPSDANLVCCTYATALPPSVIKKSWTLIRKS